VVYVFLNPYKEHSGSRKILRPKRELFIYEILNFFPFLIDNFGRRAWTRLNPDPNCECTDQLTHLNPDSIYFE
jgi:hypothetical protein